MYKIFRFFKRKYDWQAIVISVLTAALFWFLNAMNRSHSADINYPVVFSFNDQELMSTSEKSQVIRFHANGTGWELFKMKVGWWNDPISFDVASKRSYKYFLTKDLTAIVEDKLSEVIDVKYFLDDTLYTGLDRVSKVKFRIVVSRETLSLKKGYKIDGPIGLSPEYVLVTGPSSILDTMNRKITVAVKGSDIAETYSETVSLPKPPHRLLQMDEEKVEINFKVSDHKRPFSD